MAIQYSHLYYANIVSLIRHLIVASVIKYTYLILNMNLSGLHYLYVYTSIRLLIVSRVTWGEGTATKMPQYLPRRRAYVDNSI